MFKIFFYYYYMNEIISTLSELVSIKSITNSKEEKDSLIYMENKLNWIINKEVNYSWIKVTIEKIEENWLWAIVCNIDSWVDINIWLIWHLDVVPADNWTKPAFELTETDDKYYWRGVTDMKWWCAIMVEVLRESLAKKPEKNITLIFSTWEEEGAPNWLTQVKDFIKTLKIDFIIALEPTWRRINTGVFWCLDWFFVFKGVACHSSKPELWENAILKILPLIEYLKEPELIWKIEYNWEILKEALSATLIEWWIATNVVPDLCKVRINYRYLPNKKPDDVEKTFWNLAAKFWAKNFEVLDHNIASFIVEKNNPFLLDFINKTGVVDLNIVPFWSDISQTASIWIPSVNFWPGNIKQAHVKDEFIEKKDLEEIWNDIKKYLFIN